MVFGLFEILIISNFVKRKIFLLICAVEVSQSIMAFAAQSSAKGSRITELAGKLTRQDRHVRKLHAVASEAVDIGLKYKVDSRAKENCCAQLYAEKERLVSKVWNLSAQIEKAEEDASIVKATSRQLSKDLAHTRTLLEHAHDRHETEMTRLSSALEASNDLLFTETDTVRDLLLDKARLTL